MRLAGLVTQASGAHNEDGAGVLAGEDGVSAAWVFDGVTGINGANYLPADTDAAWLVQRADHHIRQLASQNRSLPDILKALVEQLVVDWQSATAAIDLPAGYDVPAACLILAKRYGDGWKTLRLGDSMILVEHDAITRLPPPESDLGHLETFLRDEARRRRLHGLTDFKSLLREFHPQLLASRKSRNTASNHSILVADPSALNCPEYLDLGTPRSLLLCTDGFYRAADTYHLLDDAGLLTACRAQGGVQDVLGHIRTVEAQDPDCNVHLRFKPADDATAIMLVS